MMSHFVRTLSIFVLAALVAGCIPGAGALIPGSVPGTVLQSEKPREISPNVSTNDQTELSAGNAAFALDLYHVLDEDGNLFYSPYSISLALAMTYAGARGETAAQMADVLHYTLPSERLHPAFNALDQELNSRKEAGGEGADGKGFRFHIVNDVWGERDYVFLEEYLDLLAENYGAGLRLMDFRTKTEESRQEINDYIARQTEDRIKDLLPRGSIDPSTRLVLTNAIYFNAAWRFKFSETGTSDAPFFLLDGSETTVPQMKMPEAKSLAYVDGDGYQAVALPYENVPISMLLLVPDAGQFAEFEQMLDTDRLSALMGEMSYNAVRVNMPKFEIEGEFGLVETLQEMGIEDAFNASAADFSGMDGTRNLFVSDVIHKSFVKVDEAGTEAAAATAVVMVESSAPMETIEMTIDRPFIFLIRDEPTGAILFMGRVVSP
jgi:serpin B